MLYETHDLSVEAEQLSFFDKCEKVLYFFGGLVVIPFLVFVFVFALFFNFLHNIFREIFLELNKFQITCVKEAKHNEKVK